MSDTGHFSKTPLTDESHMDPAKHYIGESLTAPSLEEITFSGTETATGDSPIPARADHSHDHRTRFGGYQSDDTATGRTVAAGATVYIDDLVHIWGEDFFDASFPGQLLKFPQEGSWQIHYRMVVERSTGVFPAGQLYQVRFDYNNASASHWIDYDEYPVGASQMWKSYYDLSYYPSVSASSNVQFRFTNTDTVAVDVRTYFVDMRRIASYIGAPSD